MEAVSGVAKGPQKGEAVMGWLWDIVWGFLPDFWPWLAGAIGAVGLYVLGRLNGGAKARQKQADEIGRAHV